MRRGSSLTTLEEHREAQPTQPFAYDVFVSYSSQRCGGETAGQEALSTSLCDFATLAARFSVTEMERGVTTSRKTLLVLTPPTLASQWTALETLNLQTFDPQPRPAADSAAQGTCDLLAVLGCSPMSIYRTQPNSYPWPRLLSAAFWGGAVSATTVAPPPRPDPPLTPCPHRWSSVHLPPYADCGPS